MGIKTTHKVVWFGTNEGLSTKELNKINTKPVSTQFYSRFQYSTYDF